MLSMGPLRKNAGNRSSGPCSTKSSFFAKSSSAEMPKISRIGSTTRILPRVLAGAPQATHGPYGSPTEQAPRDELRCGHLHAVDEARHEERLAALVRGEAAFHRLASRELGEWDTRARNAGRFLEARSHGARTEGHRTHARPVELGSERDGEAHDERLGGAVRRHVRDGLKPSDRGDVDDAAASLAHHRVEQAAGEGDDGFAIQAHHRRLAHRI